jgi:DNA-binding response OmpR family regulator
MMLERPAAPLPARRDPAPSSSTMRLGIIDADTGFLHVFARRLEALGWEFRVLAAPARVDDLVAMRLACLIVDPALLGPEAWTYLDTVARELPSLGLIVHTGRSSVAQRVRGLRLGADDWVAKPCHPEEMIARVESVVRRRRRAEAAQTRQSVSAGELEIRPDQFQVFVDGRSIELTRREFELIELLAGAEGRVLEREEIYQRVWGYAMAHGDRSVDVFVRKLRRKLQSASAGWSYIHTHFGIGYRFAPEPAEASEPDA